MERGRFTLGFHSEDYPYILLLEISLYCFGILFIHPSKEGVPGTLRYLLSWQFCIPFFPRPNIDLDVIVEFKSSDCFAIRKIQEFIKSVNKTITDFDPTADISATIVTAPQYRIIIKSKKITYDSYDVYVNVLKETYNVISIHMNTSDTRTEVSML